MTDVSEHSLERWRLRIADAIRGVFGARMMTISLALVACGHGAPKTAGDRPTPVADAGDAGNIELPENMGDKQNCVELVVGTAREEAVLCDEIVVDGYWRVTDQVVRVVRARKSVPVLDVLTKIEGGDSGAIWLEQRVRIASNGLSATVDGVPITDVAPAGRQSDQPGPFEDCNHASDWKGSVIEGVPRYRDLRRRSCNALGAYKWNGRRFAHQ